MALSTPAFLGDGYAEALGSLTAVTSASLSPSSNALLIVHASGIFASDQSVSSISTTLSNVGSWTFIDSYDDIPPNGATAYQPSAVAWARVTGAPGTGTITATFSGSGGYTAAIQVVEIASGYNTSTPIGEHGLYSYSLADLPVTLGATPAAASTVLSLVFVAAAGGGNDNLAPPTGYTELNDDHALYAATGINNQWFAGYDAGSASVSATFVMPSSHAGTHHLVEILESVSTVTGTSARTLAPFTSTASGSSTTGTSARTLAAFTSSASGTYTPATVTGTSARTLGSFTSTATGSSVTGTSARTLAAFTSAAGGTHAISGSSATTLAAFTSTALGSTVTGTSSQTLAAFTSSATGIGGVTSYEHYPFTQSDGVASGWTAFDPPMYPNLTVASNRLETTATSGTVYNQGYRTTVLDYTGDWEIVLAGRVARDSSHGGILVMILDASGDGYGFFVGNATHIKRYDGLVSNNLTNNGVDGEGTGGSNTYDEVRFQRDADGDMRVYLDGALHGFTNDTTYTITGSTIVYVLHYANSAGGGTAGVSSWIDDLMLAEGLDNPWPPIDGTSSTTLAAFTSGATGSTVTGSSARTLTAFVSTAAGTHTITGTSATTLAAFTSTAAGSTVTGTSGTTLAAFTSTASGTHTITGTSATTLAAFTSSASGTYTPATITGSSAQTLAAFTSTATGSVGADPTGAVAASLAAFTGTASGTAAGGSSSTTLAAFTSSASGAAGAAGTAPVTLDAFTSTAAGTHFGSVTGTSAQTLAAFLSAAGGSSTSGALAVTLAAFTATATGIAQGTVIVGESTYKPGDARRRVTVVGTADRQQLIRSET